MAAAGTSWASRSRLLLLVVSALVTGGGSTGLGAQETLDPERLGLLLRTRFPSSGAAPRLELEGDSFRASPWLACFYQRRDFRPAWSAAGAIRSDAEELLLALAAAEEDGLRPEDYRAKQLGNFAAAVRSRPDPDRLAELDLLLSDAFLTFASDLRNGKVNPRAIYSDCALAREATDLANLLEEALSAHRLGVGLAGLAPPHRDYELLRQALRRYRGLVTRGEPEPLAAGPTLRDRDRGERIAALRGRLAEAAEADAAEPPAAADSPDPDLFDASLVEEVRRFQRRHGLEEDGIAGPATLAELDQRAEDHVRQIEVNLERWRWLPRDLGRRHVRVNIAAFRLEAVEDGRTELDMRVIVGKPYTRTPIFSSAMTDVVLNPSWYVPQSIATKEILPRARKDPSYLARGGYEILPGSRLRQKPGPGNALGRVKFVFPNRFSVYLHDTPAPTLFGRTVRTFSHGCIRIEKPLDLAAWVLDGDPRWTAEAIRAGIDAGKERKVHLPRRVPVHVAYWTAWVDEGGTLQLGSDVYGRDAELARLLRGKRPAD